MEKGSYALVYQLEKDRNIEVGSLGEIDFPEGFYVYIGSAFGPGGLKRVERHRRLCKNGEGSTRWHIDYLSTDRFFRLMRAYLVPREDVECILAGKLSGDMEEEFEDFGSSDCSCSSHLRGYTTMEMAARDIEQCLKTLEKVYRVKNFITGTDKE